MCRQRSSPVSQRPWLVADAANNQHTLQHSNGLTRTTSRLVRSTDALLSATRGIISSLCVFLASRIMTLLVVNRGLCSIPSLYG